MEYRIRIMCCIIIFGLWGGCKKSNQSLVGSTGYFFANTEWTGTCHTISQQYDKPCYLRFNGDTSVSVYSLFNFQLGGSFVPTDSTRGKISLIDSLPDGRLSITVTFYETGDQEVLVIAGQKLMSGGTAPSTYNSFVPTLEKCPAVIPSLKGTSWSSKIMIDNGPTNGMYAYPDLATFAFGDNSQEFTRNGHIITYTPTDNLQLLLTEYKQVGSRVYLSGFNETSGLLVGYFGVLSPAGDLMWVDSRSTLAARLPNYLQTIYWYGPPGVAPTIYKQ